MHSKDPLAFHGGTCGLSIPLHEAEKGPEKSGPFCTLRLRLGLPARRLLSVGSLRTLRPAPHEDWVREHHGSIILKRRRVSWAQICIICKLWWIPKPRNLAAGVAARVPGRVPVPAPSATSIPRGAW